MKKSLKYNEGIILISGPTKSGKSILAEKILSDHSDVVYIATSVNRTGDSQWEDRIQVHKERRQSFWRTIEVNKSILNSLRNIKLNEAILIDSLGGIVESSLDSNNSKWNKFSNEFIKTITSMTNLIVIVAEETGWGVVPSTRIGNIYRERLCELVELVSQNSLHNLIAIQNRVLDLNIIGEPIY